VIASIKIPTKLSEINLKQYRDYVLLDEKDERKYLLQVINIFANGDLEHVEKFSINKLRKPLQKLLSLLNNETNKFEAIIDVDGIEYGFHPQLNELTVGEMADLEKFIELGLWENMHKILAVLYRRVVSKYSNLYQIEQYNGVERTADLFLAKFPVNYLHGALVFFLTIEREFILHTKIYSKQETTSKPSKQVPKQRGGGITLSKP